MKESGKKKRLNGRNPGLNLKREARRVKICKETLGFWKLLCISEKGKRIEKMVLEKNGLSFAKS